MGWGILRRGGGSGSRAALFFRRIVAKFPTQQLRGALVFGWLVCVVSTGWRAVEDGERGYFSAVF